jgi:hypothetical protein
MRDFLKWSSIRIDADEKCLRIVARAVVEKKTVSGPHVYNDSLVRSNEFLKRSSINLSDGLTAD